MGWSIRVLLIRLNDHDCELFLIPSTKSWENLGVFAPLRALLLRYIFPAFSLENPVTDLQIFQVIPAKAGAYF